MKYDFDTPVNRRDTFSLKWDIPENELPMWVADMDLRTAPEIIQAIERRAAHGVYGYTIVPDEWYETIMKWWEVRYHFEIRREWLMFCTGVIAAVSSIVRRVTAIGENVVILTPVYNIFANSIVNNGRHLLECPLVYEKGNYEIDFADLEQKLAHPETTMLIFCNPHNPVGKIWSAEEMALVGELCRRHHVTVVSDEIHCDLTVPGESYTPFASVSDICRNISITCIAPTKTFNLAGIHTAAVFAANEALRRKVSRGINNDEVAEPNAFAVTAAVAAYGEGAGWLEELREYLQENRRAVGKYLAEKLPRLHLVQSKATYLLWIDCSGLRREPKGLAAFIRRDTGLYLTDGSVYGGNGNQFLRMNIACPRESVMDGMERLDRGIRHFEEL